MKGPLMSNTPILSPRERLALSRQAIVRQMNHQSAEVFKGEPGEQATMFFLDPCGNALEFKAFGDLSRLFAK